MTTSALLDRIIDNTFHTDSSDADYQTHRTLVLEWAQQVFEEVWNAAPWPWKYKPDTWTVPAAQGYVAVPTDFVEIGPFGQVLDSQGRRVTEASPVQVHRAQNQNANTDIPSIFSIHISDTGVLRFNIPLNGSALSFTVLYSAAAATLVDATDATNKLTTMPPQLHFPVVLTGTQAFAYRHLGADEAEAWESRYRENLATAIKQETLRRSAIRRLPRSIPRGMY